MAHITAEAHHQLAIELAALIANSCDSLGRQLQQQRQFHLAMPKSEALTFGTGAGAAIPSLTGFSGAQLMPSAALNLAHMHSHSKGRALRVARKRTLPPSKSARARGVCAAPPLLYPLLSTYCNLPSPI